MKILHICNGFAGSKVHSNLTKALDSIGTEQIVYCPLLETKYVGHHQFDGHHIKFIYSVCIKPWHKYIYQLKQYILYRDLKKQVSFQDIDIIHAPSLFSDGGLAYKAYKDYRIPYVIAVRNTDINSFMKPLMKHTHPYGRKIALHASKIYFISKAEMEEFISSRVFNPIMPLIKDKLVFQPNGIEDFWTENVNTTQRDGRSILYIGDFTPNKNVCRIIDAISELRNTEKYSNIRLTIVGGGRDVDNQVQNKISQNSDIIDFKGKIYEKDILASIMKTCALFVMPSIHETFGLVYIEALSQNLPVIYSKGQGIDGIFDDSVGIGVNSKSTQEIKDAIIEILDNPTKYSNSSVNFKEFNWTEIAYNYKNQFKEVLLNNK